MRIALATQKMSGGSYTKISLEHKARGLSLLCVASVFVSVYTHCSLRMTATGAIAVVRVLQCNKTLEELK